MPESQLVLVDYQPRLMPAILEGERGAGQRVRLARMARLLDVPVWGTEQNPAGLGATCRRCERCAGALLPKMHSAPPRRAWCRMAAAAGREPQGGNARSLPKHLQKPAAERERRATPS